MKKLLITGGAGFIGSEFVRNYFNQYSITVLDDLSYAGDLERIAELDSKINFYKANISNRNFLEPIFSSSNFDYIIHFAAESHVDRSIIDSTPFVETNVKGTQTLLDLAKDYGIKKFINISTDEVYGDLDESGQFFEHSMINPSSPYSATKASADMLGRAYHRTFDLPVITVRPSNNYGSWQYPEKLLPVVILKAFNNEKIPIYGDGKNVREWLNVSDCANAVNEILKHGRIGETYNVGSGVEKENMFIVESVLNYLNKSNSLIEFVKDRPGHDFRYSLNAEKIQNELKWSPQISFNDGLIETIDWYIKNMKWVESKKEELENYWKTVY